MPRRPIAPSKDKNDSSIVSIQDVEKLKFKFGERNNDFQIFKHLDQDGDGYIFYQDNESQFRTIDVLNFEQFQQKVNIVEDVLPYIQPSKERTEKQIELMKQLKRKRTLSLQNSHQRYDNKNRSQLEIGGDVKLNEQQRYNYHRLEYLDEEKKQKKMCQEQKYQRIRSTLNRYHDSIQYETLKQEKKQENSMQKKKALQASYMENMNQDSLF